MVTRPLNRIPEQVIRGRNLPTQREHGTYWIYTTLYEVANTSDALAGWGCLVPGCKKRELDDGYTEPYDPNEPILLELVEDYEEKESIYLGDDPPFFSKSEISNFGGGGADASVLRRLTGGMVCIACAIKLGVVQPPEDVRALIEVFRG